jgi:23S rRNA (uracil1939-C5)-methyltransferase
MDPAEPADGPVELRIETIGARGDGIGRFEGRPVYVAGSLPGDRLRVRIERRRGDGFAARAIEVLAAGPGRATPPCPHFGECGGCALQHLQEAPYADWKRGLVAQHLARRGLGEVPVDPLVRVPPTSRRRVSLAAERRGGSVRLGFHARASHRVIDATDCRIVTPRIAALLPRLRAALPQALGDGEAAQILATETDGGLDLLIGAARASDREAREALARFAEAADLARLCWKTPTEAPEPIAIRRPAQLRFGGVRVDLPPGAFVQPTAAGEAALVARVTKAVAGARAIADLYAGCGTFAFPLAGAAAVHAVEGDAAAIGALAAAARRANLAGRVSTERRDLAAAPLAPAELARFDAVVFDPPRAGAKEQAARLARSGVGRIVAVSCDPATFARDARILADGGYRLDRVTPIDQFLWSPHVELAAMFRRS